MGIANLNEISPEKRLELLEQARIAREAKKEAGKHLRQDWADAPVWDYLRSELAIKSPLYYIPASETKYISRTLKKLGKDTGWFYEHFCQPVSKWAILNPKAPAYVLQGLMMEAARPDLVAKFRGVNNDEV